MPFEDTFKNTQWRKVEQMVKEKKLCEYTVQARVIKGWIDQLSEIKDSPTFYSRENTQKKTMCHHRHK